jgi:hypothetical protein
MNHPKLIKEVRDDLEGYEEIYRFSGIITSVELCTTHTLTLEESPLERLVDITLADPLLPSEPVLAITMPYTVSQREFELIPLRKALHHQPASAVRYEAIDPVDKELSLRAELVLDPSFGKPYDTDYFPVKKIK